MRVGKSAFIGSSALFIAVLVAASGTPADAQSSGMGGVPQALAKLQESLDELAARLDEHTAASAVGNVRYTPEVLVGASEDIACAASNVANEQRLVNLEIIAQPGNVAASTSIALQPGQASPQFVLSSGSGNYYCRLTVENGSRADIRGVVRVFDSATLIASQSLSAE